jgi:hypothetical protein
MVFLFNVEVLCGKKYICLTNLSPMKRSLLFLIFISFYFEVSCQEISREAEFRRNEIFLELGGNGLLGSINYERQFTNKPGLGMRVGAGVYGTDTHLTVPLGLNYLIRFFKSRSFVDLGLGVTYIKYNVQLYALAKREEGYVEKNQYFYFIPSAGLKVCSSKNYVFRLYATPVWTTLGPLPFVGLGFGKRF